jgi:hypothetical protein
MLIGPTTPNRPGLLSTNADAGATPANLTPCLYAFICIAPSINVPRFLANMIQERRLTKFRLSVLHQEVPNVGGGAFELPVRFLFAVIQIISNPKR